MPVRYVLFVGGGEEDETALRMLRERLGDELMVIDVRRNGVRGWMLWEYGTDRTPLLASPSGVYYGLKAIKSFVETLRKC